MKKLALVAVLGVVLAIVGVFADHPSGWGVGLDVQLGGSWDKDYYGDPGARYALSLKAPQLPIFWGITLDINNNWFGIGITGDYYLIDKLLVKNIGLGWYLGLGGYVNVNIWDLPADYSWTSIGLGARLPIGLSWQPLDFLEVFLDFGPSLGLAFGLGDAYDDHIHFPDGGWAGDFGIRFWF
ncbi:hypothetical protein [Leadbettera azotonutricia]|uniref:Outer membrane protein beta-barrel domain-containing protein n=1 Tax=Leadbettera azotonutricia (strain ATCC BAA-888 / DSM 13862 / ZAS-9) TaxID=545695 RepID=F5YBJ7_LEAAZ|nr:hypothetical protein [Leadbettera azotonutricia]AEF80196.1 hypothetical protein TREAZ_0583 [Leadbettera azotonutricia ZAS-9]